MTLAGALTFALLAAAAAPDAPVPPPREAPDAGAPASSDPSSLLLGVGTQKILAAPRLRAVAVAAPEVLDVRPLGSSELLVVGLAAGHSDLTVFFEDGTHTVYRIEVGQDGASDESSALRSAFKDSPGLSVQFAGDRVFLTGLFGSLEDYERSRLFPQAVCLAKLDPKVVRARVAMVNDALTQAGLKNARAVLHGTSTLALEGVVHDTEEKAKAQKIADAIFTPVGKAVDALEKSGVR
ncbi:MAG: pilus assembly protein N-terminal domain-containing protein [Myxococcales bacterium]